VFQPEDWGVEQGYWDVAGQWRPASPKTVEAALAAMGADPQGPPSPNFVTVRLDHPLPDLGPGTVVFEDGGEVRVEGALPAHMPPGYHRFVPEADGGPIELAVSPGRVPLPRGPTWGVAAQVYSLRSATSWGIGDLGDLGRLCQLAGQLGAGVVLASPLHAGALGSDPQPSPYYPSSRCFYNPIYLDMERLLAARAGVQLGDWRRVATQLNESQLIERPLVWRLKREVLEAIFEADLGGGDETGQLAALSEFRARRGLALEDFATYCALAERHGQDWRRWPEGLRHRGSGQVMDFSRSPEGSRRIAFHCWLQFLLDHQIRELAQLSRPAAGLVCDLAIGSDPGGADAWVWQDLLASSFSVGAPPDEFNGLGQDWGLVPYDPWRLRAASYRPWLEAVRSNLVAASGLRVDHVMGLSRLYWVPSDGGPTKGAYVRYPRHDLLNLLALEAHRAGGFVVGEDLGTVEDAVRADLAERQVLSSRVWWFEPAPTPAWPEQALGSVSTHDLPTVAGVWDGSDLEAQRSLGLHPNEEAFWELRRRLCERTGVEETAPLEEVIARAYEDLARAPCTVLVASLEDLQMVSARPNMPGTLDQWPNWRQRLPKELESLLSDALVARVARALSRSRTST